MEFRLKKKKIFSQFQGDRSSVTPLLLYKKLFQQKGMRRSLRAKVYCCNGKWWEKMISKKIYYYSLVMAK